MPSYYCEKLKKSPKKNIQVYAERLITLGQDAFDGVPDDVKDKQLVNYFIDGLFHDFMKMKIMRENVASLQIAIDVATAEQNLRKRFSLRTGLDTMRRDNGPSRDNEPMKVDNFRKQKRCFYCGLRDCKKLIGAVSQDKTNARQQNLGQIQCYKCRGFGYISRFCTNDRNTNNNRACFRGK